MHRIRLLLTVLAAVLAQGCAIHKPQITADAIDFNEAVENTNNEVTFLNILRSYHRAPRHYTSISDIKGNFTVVANGAIASTLATSRQVGSSVADGVLGTTDSTAGNAVTPSIGASYQTNPNYTIAVLESQDFYNGILKPIDLQTLTLFRQQGWTAELLINLLFEHVVLTIQEGDKKAVLKIDNEAEERGWAELADILALRTKSVAGKERVLGIASSLSPQDIAKLVEQKVSTRRCTAKDSALGCAAGSDYVIYQPGAGGVGLDVFRRASLTPASKAYLKRSLQSGDPQLVDRYLQTCASDDNGRKATVFSFLDNLNESRTSVVDDKGGNEICKSKLLISTRSTDGIFYYIGEYLETVLDKGLPQIRVGRSNEPLFIIEKNSKAPAVLETTFGGDRYTVPKAHGRTMQIFGLLQQLVNLNKKSEDLPKAQLIQIQ